MGVSYTVTYYCPRCGTLAGLERDGYLDDKSVTPYPFEGWSYVTPEASFDDADGVRFVCGEDAVVSWEASPTGEKGVAGADTEPDADTDGTDDTDLGCGEPFYLSFVRFENGQEVDPRAPNEQVELAEGRGPTGPGGPDGPTGPDGGGFWG